MGFVNTFYLTLCVRGGRSRYPQAELSFPVLVNGAEISSWEFFLMYFCHGSGIANTPLLPAVAAFLSLF